MPDKSIIEIIEKLLSNATLALILIGAFLVWVAASGGFPKLSMQVDEPGWRIALAILGSVLVGTGVWGWWQEKKTEKTPEGISTPKEPGELLEKMEFDYSDSPTEHGWQVVDCLDETQVIISPLDDGFVGKAIEVTSKVRYAMDYHVRPVARLGSIVEFVAILENTESTIYACFTLQSSDGSRSKPGLAYLSFPVGKGPPSPYGDGSMEWTFPVEPVPLYPGGRWARFRIDLNEAVRQTFGTSGWKFGQLVGFRLRGNLSLAHISVFQAK